MPYPDELQISMWLGNSLQCLCRPRADKAHVQAQRRHEQASALHSRTRGPREHHDLAGTRYPSMQAGWQTHKRRQGMRRQAQSTRRQEGHAVQAPGSGEMRPTRMVDDGQNERSVGMRSRLVAEDLVVFLNLPGSQPVSAARAAERVGSCHLISTTPLINGRGRPARTHPNKQPAVLRQCHVAWQYCSADASAGPAPRATLGAVPSFVAYPSCGLLKYSTPIILF